MRWLEITAQYHNHKFITDEKYYGKSQRRNTLLSHFEYFCHSLSPSAAASASLLNTFASIGFD